MIYVPVMVLMERRPFKHIHYSKWFDTSYSHSHIVLDLRIVHSAQVFKLYGSTRLRPQAEFNVTNFLLTERDYCVKAETAAHTGQSTKLYKYSPSLTRSKLCSDDQPAQYKGTVSQYSTMSTMSKPTSARRRTILYATSTQVLCMKHSNKPLPVKRGPPGTTGSM